MLHHDKLDAFRAKYNDLAFLVFRVLIGLFFIVHGVQKVFGLAGKDPQPLASLMGVAGIIELVGGLFIVLGLFTGLVALICAIEMAVAYFMAHAPKGFLPLLNGGELALIYFAVFLYLIFEGGGKYSLDAKLCEKCTPRK